MLAVDNFNGAKVLGRTIRCDHCQDYHEEQAKDPANLPEHVTRNLSEKELDKKRREVEARNAELEEASAAKEGLFAVGRGTYEDERQRDERQIRNSIVQVSALSAPGRAPGPSLLRLAKPLSRGSRRRPTRTGRATVISRRCLRGRSRKPASLRRRRRASRPCGRSARERARRRRRPRRAGSSRRARRRSCWIRSASPSPSPSGTA